jgi:hypothetical protein
LNLFRINVFIIRSFYPVRSLTPAGRVDA